MLCRTTPVWRKLEIWLITISIAPVCQMPESSCLWDALKRSKVTVNIHDYNLCGQQSNCRKLMVQTLTMVAFWLQCVWVFRNWSGDCTSNRFLHSSSFTYIVQNLQCCWDLKALKWVMFSVKDGGKSTSHFRDINTAQKAHTHEHKHRSGQVLA